MLIFFDMKTITNDYTDGCIYSWTFHDLDKKQESFTVRAKTEKEAYIIAFRLNGPIVDYMAIHKHSKKSIYENKP